MFELPGGVKREEWVEEPEEYALVMWQEGEKWFFGVTLKKAVTNQIIVAAVTRYHHVKHRDIVGERYDYFSKGEVVMWRYGFADTPHAQWHIAMRFDDGSWRAVSVFGPPRERSGPEECDLCVVKPPPGMIVRVVVTNIADGTVVFSRDVGQ